MEIRFTLSPYYAEALSRIINEANDADPLGREHNASAVVASMVECLLDDDAIAHRKVTRIN